MSDNGSANPSQSTGLLTAGIVIAGLVVAAAVLSMRDAGGLSDEAVAALEATSQVRTNQVATQETADALPQGAPSSDQPPAAVETPADIAGTDTATAPSIDEVRIDAGGVMVIAGRAGPGADVDVLVDGNVVASTQADASGAFAALGSVAADQAARSLTVRSGSGDEAVASVDEIILAPVTSVSDASTVDQPAEPASEPPVVAMAPPDTSEAAESGASANATATLLPKEPAQAQEPADAEQPVETDLALLEPDRTEADAPAPSSTGSEIAILRSDEQGVSRVQPAPVSRVTLDTISYSDEGAVQLGGRAGSAAVEVRAYLDNQAVARIAVDGDGAWRGVVKDVAAGVYNLRVDALGQDGKVTSRLETPFKREAPEVLAAATQPATGTVRAVTVQAGDTLWAIARDRYGEGLLYVQVFEANRSEIRDPDLIYPGQVFDLPQD